MKRFHLCALTLVIALALFGSSNLAVASGGPGGGGGNPPPSPPPGIASLVSLSPSIFSGGGETIEVQLTAGLSPVLGSVVQLTSSNPTAAPLPATLTFPQGSFLQDLTVVTRNVTTSTPVTVTARLNATSASTSFTILPPSLQSISVASSITGGVGTSGGINLNGVAPPGGATVSVSSSNPSVASVAATAAVAAGQPNGGFTISTTAVSAGTSATITVSWQGVSFSATLIVTPQQAPASLTVNPTSATGMIGANFINVSTGTVTMASPASSNTPFFLSSSNPSAAGVNGTVQVPQGATSATFPIFVAAVTTSTSVTISVTGAGVTQTAILTVLPEVVVVVPLSSVTILNSSSTQGGNEAFATATLSAPAPQGGAIVTMTSSNPAVASVPASHVVGAGSINVTFVVTTHAVSVSTPVTLTASSGGVARTTTLTVTAPSTVPADTVTVTLAEYEVSKQVLNAQATSTSSNATPNVVETSSGAHIGTLTNVGGGKYQGQLPWSVNPQNITVTSSLGGSATLAETPK